MFEEQCARAGKTAVDQDGCAACAPSSAGSPTHLCGTCERRVREELAELPCLYEACEPLRTRAGANLQGRVTGSRQIDAPLSEAAIAIRSEIVNTLASWTELVLVERSLGADRAPRREVGSLAAFLTRHLPWLAAHPAASEFAEEIGGLAQGARSCADPRELRVELGECTVAGCESMVFAELNGAGAAAPASVRCAAGHRWPPSRWLLLAEKLQGSTKAAQHADGVAP